MLLGACYQAGFAQEDSTKTKENDADTIRVGGIIIIKKGGNNSSEIDVNKNYHYSRKHKKSNITTNWMIVDLGFSGFNDRTNYNTAEAQAFLQNPNGSPWRQEIFHTGEQGFQISVYGFLCKS